MSGFRVKQIFFYKGLTRIPDIAIYSCLSFFSITGDWGELGIPNLAQTSLKKFY